jgi:hypothetical protein
MPHVGPVWWLVALLLMVLFVALILTEASRNKDK